MTTIMENNALSLDLKTRLVTAAEVGYKFPGSCHRYECRNIPDIKSIASKDLNVFI